MERYSGLIIAFVVLVGSITVITATSMRLPGTPHEPYVPAIAVSSPFKYTFNSPGTLYEAGSMDQSTSPYWWVNSGGKMIFTSDAGQTIQGSLATTDPWRTQYAIANPIDTDNGTHPQNLFRLVSRQSWNNVRQEADFYIVKDNLSASTNRNASNGLLFMSRYSADGQTLYYGGIRVDGTAVIKKKYNGAYYTMTQPVVFAGTYSRNEMPNVLPHGKWIRLRLDTKTNADGSVSLVLSMQNPTGATWKQIASAKDTGSFGGTPPITGSKYVGIRTDFMDVKFDSYEASNL